MSEEAPRVKKFRKPLILTPGERRKLVESLKALKAKVEELQRRIEKLGEL